MLIEVDPVAREIVLDLENGKEPMSFPLGCLLLKYHSAQAGTLALHLDEKEVELSYHPLPDEPSSLHLEPLATRRWRFAFKQGLSG